MKYWLNLNGWLHLFDTEESFHFGFKNEYLQYQYSGDKQSDFLIFSHPSENNFDRAFTLKTFFDQHDIDIPHTSDMTKFEIFYNDES